MTAAKGASAVFEASRAIDAEITGLSWGGFNLFGDRKSIRELERLMGEASAAEALRRRLKEVEPKA